MMPDWLCPFCCKPIPDAFYKEHLKDCEDKGEKK